MFPCLFYGFPHALTSVAAPLQFVSEMKKAYEQEWAKLTQNYYLQSPWPSPGAISDLVEGGKQPIRHVSTSGAALTFAMPLGWSTLPDPTFLCLYKELTIRHMYAKLHPRMPTLKQRFEAWENYLKLFNGILGA